MGTKENDVRLSGGVFFSLLLRARKQRTAVRGNDLTSSDGLTQTDALRDLIRVFYPGYKEPSKGTRPSVGPMDTQRTVSSPRC